MRRAELRKQLEQAASNSQQLSERLDVVLANGSYRLPTGAREEIARVSERLRIAASGAGVELRAENLELAPTKRWASVMVIAGASMLGALGAGVAEAAGEDVWSGIKRLSALVVEDASAVESSQAPTFRNRSGSIILDAEDASLLVRRTDSETIPISLRGPALATVEQADSLLRLTVFRDRTREGTGVYLLAFKDDMDHRIVLDEEAALALRDADSIDRGLDEPVVGTTERFGMIIIDLAQVDHQGQG